MGKRVAITQCINPAHNDSSPSMAVYDHGQDKLQVFCFGCKYHAWVYPEQVELTTPKEYTSATPGMSTRQPLPVNRADYGYLYNDIESAVHTYCTDRSLSVMDGQLLLDRVRVGVDARHRMYMEWSIYTLIGKYVGTQTRYLDDAQPKTRYSKGIDIDNTHMLYYSSLVPVSVSTEYDVVITESAFDSFWAQQTRERDRNTLYLTTLGTPDSIDWEYGVRFCVLDANAVYLYFDVDIPGSKTTQAILYWWKSNTNNTLPINVMEGMPEGTKVYELCKT